MKKQIEKKPTTKGQRTHHSRNRDMMQQTGKKNRDIMEQNDMAFGVNTETKKPLDPVEVELLR